MNNATNNRYQHIDFLRSVAIIGIVAVHTFYYHSSNRLYFFLWNYLHFVVVVFVFCSGYVLTARYKNQFNTILSTLSWYRKRLIRLLIPFYIYLIIHYLLWFIFPRYFSGLGLQRSFSFILRSIILTGGVDSNWLPLLFIQLTILFPLFIYTLKKRTLLFLCILLPLAAAFYFTIISFPTNSYRFVMWLPWSGILLLSMFFYFKERKKTTVNKSIKRYLILGLAGMILFLIMFLLGNPTNNQFLLTNHKYPPDAYYLSYALSIMFFLLAISRVKILNNQFFIKFFKYISQHSYQLFFIQYIVLDFVLKTTKGLSFWSNPMTQFICIMVISLALTFFSSSKTIFLILALTFLLVNKFNNLGTCSIIDTNPVAFSSVFEWIQKPAAVRFEKKHDRTYISWVENKGKLQMRYYDHISETFSKIYTVDDLSLDYGIEAQDDHNAPSLLILPNGRILIFYVVHDVNNAFFMKTSVNTEDISLWGSRINISDTGYRTPYNYPQPKRLNNGNIFLFYRRGIYNNSDEYFKISTDNGQTWGNPTNIIDFGTAGVYAFIYSKDNQIHIAWNKAVAGPPKKNVYYMYSSDGGTTWKKRDGIVLTLPVTEIEADLVFDSGNDPDYVWDIVVDNQYNPFIAFAYKNDPHHQFRLAKWNGLSWVTNVITTSAELYDSGHFFSGGIVIDPQNVYKVYLSKKRTNLEIESWVSSDNGETWQKSESLTKNSAVDNFRPQTVQNYSEDLRVVWSSGLYDGLINSHWMGFNKVNIQSEVTKNSIPLNNCK